MAGTCAGGQYLDRLLKQCMPCQLVCDNPDPPTRCLDFCVAFSCKAVSGQFYDQLLKKCLKCSELCGHHPSECSQECPTRAPTPGITRPGSITALQPRDPRGSHRPREVPHSEVLVYALLGLCLAMLLGTVLVALLVLLRRARGQKEDQGEKVQQPDGHSQTSKDCLMADAATQEGGAEAPDRPLATETCVHCFAEQTGTMYQQAIPRFLNGDPHHHHHHNYCSNGLVHGHAVRNTCERDGTLRIICSPTQTSM
ncbi:tumor necrosis factor receptor superfamily member 13B [Astyanax mexicanus]|uniref:Tumor necrosis factor receptor superfamily member 13B n=2 Tax=Astyanax mexicanus TaxID=7994 RepID=A0A8T2L6Q2_ASTMX|nr:tumor necrosis factor receptor superfamily member 13B [Astyanax mexicanus]KAG9267350.1 tumor necrosis factor receptor superfamily member 13B [Astyanax mexicanus]